MTVFDPERVVAFPTLSLASGAVKGWDRRNAYTFSMLEAVAAHYKFDIDLPFEELPETARPRCCSMARARTRSSLSTRPKALAAAGGTKKRSVKRSHPFEGILPNLQRRFKETDSSAVREDLARNMAPRSCPHCEGSRLRREGPPCGAAAA